jgi:hypothetical protein
MEGSEITGVYTLHEISDIELPSTSLLNFLGFGLARQYPDSRNIETQPFALLSGPDFVLALIHSFIGKWGYEKTAEIIPLNLFVKQNPPVIDYLIEVTYSRHQIFEKTAEEMRDGVFPLLGNFQISDSSGTVFQKNPTRFSIFYQAIVHRSQLFLFPREFCYVYDQIQSEKNESV